MKAITILWVILLVFPSVYGDSLSTFCFNSQTIPIQTDLQGTYHIQIGDEVRELYINNTIYVDFTPKKTGVQEIEIKVLETNEIIKSKFNIQECILIDLPEHVVVNSSNLEVKVKNLGEEQTILIDSTPFESDASSLTLGNNEVKSFNLTLPTNVQNKKIEQTIFIKTGERVIERETNLIFGNPFPYIWVSSIIVLLILVAILIVIFIPKPIVSRKNKKLVKKIDNRINHSEKENDNKQEA